ncbi:MAG: hypothetical protein WBH86_02580 [Thermogutta sp.]|nr:hypothetical protein [Thermogutta sp.]HPZ83505.1 hypothetical protein [Thermogutta sp.]HQF12864.1 hypothetical protein [Thermogutta sp.]
MLHVISCAAVLIFIRDHQVRRRSCMRLAADEVGTLGATDEQLGIDIIGSGNAGDPKRVANDS